VWMYDPAEGGYAPVTAERYAKLLAGGFKF
jgi:fatty-acyl-CoA synthase